MIKAIAMVTNNINILQTAAITFNSEKFSDMNKLWLNPR